MRLSHLAPLALGLFALASSLRAQSDHYEPQWQAESLLLFSENSAEFTRLRADGPRDRRTLDYMDALVIMHAPDGGAKNAKIAEARLNLLLESGKDDAVANAARFYLARIAQSFQEPPDLEEAKQRYLELFESRKESFFGQLAFIKYLTLAIYDEETSEMDPLNRIAAIEAHGPEITIPSLSQNFYRMLGDAYMHYDVVPESALAHYESALKIGISIDMIRFEVMQNAAQLCERLGHRDRAIRWYSELATKGPIARRAEFEKNVARLKRS